MSNSDAFLHRTLAALACAAVAVLSASGHGHAESLQANGCDFNGGFDDLAIGIPGESIGTAEDAGAVEVLYGTASGLAAAGSQHWTQNSADMADEGDLNDRFGEAVACGDFDNDGFDDLVVGVPSEDFSGLTDAGAVHVLYGRAAGLRALGSQLWTSDSTDVPGVAESQDRFGSAVAAGDFNGDGFDDLAVGTPGESIGVLPLAGAVTVLYGSVDGLVVEGSRVFTQDVAAIVDAAEARDLFGAALASGDFDGDLIDDLAIAVPMEDLGSLADAGAVNVIYGDATGLNAVGNHIFTQDSSGVDGTGEAYDLFGFALVAGKFNNDTRSDLAIGAPGEDLVTRDSAGALHILYGAAAGLTGAADGLFTQDTTGITGNAASRDRFGAALTRGDFNGDGRDDVAVSAPGDTLSRVTEMGTVHVLYGSATGIRAAADQFWHQNFGTLLGTAEARDWLGESLAAGDFNSDGRADLSMGAPGDNVGAINDVGSVNVLYGAPTGLVEAGNQLWNQAGAGVAGTEEVADRLSGRLHSDGTYRIPYVNGTQVRVDADRLTHSPQDRIDMAAVSGTQPYAIVVARAGTIEAIVDDNAEPTDEDNYVWISHADGEWTKYGNLATGSVTAVGRFEGEAVVAGMVLGSEGDVGQESGNHLHFEVGVPYDVGDAIDAEGSLKGENRDPLICGISGNSFVTAPTYPAKPC